MNLESLLKLRAGNTFYEAAYNTGTVVEYYVRKIFVFDPAEHFPNGGVCIEGKYRYLYSTGLYVSDSETCEAETYFTPETQQYGFLTRSRNRAIRKMKEAWDLKPKWTQEMTEKMYLLAEELKIETP